MQIVKFTKITLFVYVWHKKFQCAQSVGKVLLYYNNKIKTAGKV